MDWEANLAAIIKCTDANLEQQFRQFEDVTAEFAADEARSVHDPGDNVASTYLRDSMASEYHHRQQYEQMQAPARQTPSYARVSGAFARAPPTSASTFSEHFHRRQERKRGATAGRSKDNQRIHRRGNEYESAEEEGHAPEHGEVDEPRYAAARPAQAAYHQQIYSSPTYDMAQMMEQVRLSLKLEVDARAAIAERQLSALLQLCKATSEELDRLRVEVCANDRQLHTLDQVQSKIRQELTTQKDIGFHLQSMCGKDESWRMQAENQLLELRQMVAALREQGNSTQAVAQEKLSRSELLVQFNAAMEPIKAQLQANLQHQAQQIAEVTRTTSSSSLLLDGITQKVNRGITDELNELRSDLSALKHHVAKLDIFHDGSRGLHGKQARSPTLSKEEQEMKAKEEQQQQERQATELREGLVKDLTTLAKDYVDAQTKPIREMIDEAQSRFVAKRELETVQNALETSCRGRVATAIDRVDRQLKSSCEQLQREWNAAIRDTTDRVEKSMKQSASVTTSAIEGQSSLWQSKQLESMKTFEREQKDRKQALDELQEAVRKSRHQLEDQIHSLAQESRSQLAQRDCDLEKRVKQVEKQVEDTVVDFQKETQAAVAALKTTLQAQGDHRGSEWDQKLKRLEETVAATNLAVSEMSRSVASSAAVSSSTTASGSSAKDASLALERQANVYASMMENLLQKMQLQVQLQAQSQAQLAMAPSPYHGYWPSSPYAASPHPPPPTLHLPPATKTLIAASSIEQSAVTPVRVVTGKSPHPSSPAPSRLSSSVGVDAEAKSSAECLGNPASVTEAEQLPSPVPSTAAPRAPLAQEQNASKAEDDLVTGLADSTDQTSKRENTIATTAKGALVEAELAKARVENRRKQELETKQQRYVPVSASDPKDNSNLGITTSSHENSPGSDSRRLSVPVVPTPISSAKASSLARSASSSALPGKIVTVSSTVNVAGAKDSTPTRASSKSAEDSASVSPLSASTAFEVPLPQLMTKPGGSVVEKATIPMVAQQNEVKIPSQPPPPAPSAVIASTPQTCDVDVVPALPAHSTLNDSLLLSPQSNDPPPQYEPQALTLPVSPPAKGQLPPPLSPLAKIFSTVTEGSWGAVSSTDESKTSVADKPPAPEPSQETEVPPTVPLPPTASTGTAFNPLVSHVLCVLCRLPVRSDLKNEHEKSQCPKRLVECVACKQRLQWVGLEMHELECSSRRATEDSTSAGSANETSSTPEAVTESAGSLKKCRHCAADVPSLDLLEHEINCDKVLKQCPHCLRRQKMSELQDHIENCDCRLVSCPNDCGGKFLQRGILNHLATRCPKKLVTTTTAGSTAPPRTAYPETTKSSSVPTATPPPAAFATGKVECKFCDDEIEASKIDDHEQSCDWKPKRCQHCNMVVISRDLRRHETSCRTNLKACPHCNENLPQSALTTHASRCSKRPIKCIRCCQLFPADAIVAHSTNCKFVLGTSPSAASTPSLEQNQIAASRVPIKIPPPPPFPPPPTATPVPGSQQMARRASADPRMNAVSSADIVKAAPVEETAGDRLARRNLALSQLTNPGVGVSTQHDRNSATRASAPSLYTTATSSLEPRPIIQPDGHNHAVDDEEDDGDDEVEDYEDSDDDQLTLAQVVEEWSVENVCLWLHEDVGVPEVVLRFQQKQCNGEMLLELTESDLINDFGVKDRIQRERILTAIEAIKTSDAFSDEDDDEDNVSEDEDGELDESEDYNINDTAASQTTHMRHSIGGATYTHPRDILRRKSQPSPQIGSALPSSNDMLRRISSALEKPKL